jgi:hypothetical protein
MRQDGPCCTREVDHVHAQDARSLSESPFCYSESGRAVHFSAAFRHIAIAVFLKASKNCPRSPTFSLRGDDPDRPHDLLDAGATLPGRDSPVDLAPAHLVNGKRLALPFPQGLEPVMFSMGCDVVVASA